MIGSDDDRPDGAAEEIEARSAAPAHPVAEVALLASVFVVAGAGLVYELVAGAVSSYVLGDAVTQFSLVIGVFLCSMGIGSYLARFIRHRLLETFVELEIWIGLLGGVSSTLMFAVNAFFQPLFGVVFYAICTVLGILVGIEIPVLVRLLDGWRSAGPAGFRESLSNVLALDYLGALAGSLLFPFVALPWLGLSRASVVFGLMNLGVAAVGITLTMPPRRGRIFRLTAAVAALLAVLVGSTRLVGFLEDMLYQDELILARDSAYQRIVITRWNDDVRLYLNGHIQFSSVDEAHYHESLVVPAMSATVLPRSVLILGGGDGLAAREVLEFDSVETITLVDIDPMMTELAASRPELVALNGGALRSPRLTIVHRDAMSFLEEDRGFYDVIIMDLPDPSTPTLAKLYSREFFALAARRLSLGGTLATQATSPFFAGEAFWCIVATIEGALEHADETGSLLPLPYHVHVPSFGEWGFVLAARHEIDPSKLTVDVPTHFLTAEMLPGLFVFGADVQRIDTPLNRLDDPVLHTAYRRGWDRFNQ